MSRRVIPFAVAAVTGIASGIYIFKPLVDKSSQSSSDAPHLASVTPAAGAVADPDKYAEPASDLGVRPGDSTQSSNNPQPPEAVVQRKSP